MAVDETQRTEHVPAAAPAAAGVAGAAPPHVPSRPVDLDDVPATGAWQPAHDPGRRAFTSPRTHPFSLEGGGVLRGVVVAYETWGELAPDAGNAILLCHALTGDSHAAGPSGHGHLVPGWWDELVGPGRAFDTDRFFVVCANVLGGCQGTTGPASADPATATPYGSRFPVVSIRDMVRAEAIVADELGIRRWHCVAGGSMGGMQVLEWGVMFPERVGALLPIATCAAASPWQIALSAVERQAIVLDPAFCGGDYYDRGPGDGPHHGLAVARAIAQISYRSDAVFEERFGRHVIDPLDTFDLWGRFDVEGYLDYHGAKLARRFDANSYLRLSKAMDLHDVGRGRDGVARALGRINAPTRTMSITSDLLYPPYQQHRIVEVLAANGVDAADVTIESPHGHDAFLIEHGQVGAAVAQFLEHLDGRHG